MADMTPEHRNRYGGLMHAMVSQAESYIKNAVPATKAGKIIADIVGNKSPKTRYFIGRDAKMVRFMNWLLPDRWLDKAVASSMKSHYPKNI